MAQTFMRLALQFYFKNTMLRGKWGEWIYFHRHILNIPSGKLSIVQVFEVSFTPSLTTKSKKIRKTHFNASNLNFVKMTRLIS